MKPISQLWKNLSWKSAGAWCKQMAVRGGVFLLYAAGVYLAAMAWMYEPWSTSAPIQVAVTLAGIAVFAAAWYLGNRAAPAPDEAPVRQAPLRQTPRPKPKSKKR